MTVCHIALNPHVLISSTTSPSPRSMVLILFQTPLTFLPLTVGGGSKKYFCLPTYVAPPHYFRPPPLILLTAYPPSEIFPKPLPNTTYTPHLHLSSTHSTAHHLACHITSLTTLPTHHLPLILPPLSICHLSPHSRYCPLSHLLPYPSTLHIIYSSHSLDTCPHVIISISQLHFPT
jgi:hypothetical protein